MCVRQLTLAALPTRYERKIPIPFPADRPSPRPPAKGFEQVERFDSETVTLIRYRAARPRLVTPRQLLPRRLDRSQPGALLTEGRIDATACRKQEVAGSSPAGSTG